MSLNFKKSAETEALIELFRTMPILSNMSFADASKVVGFTVASTSPAYQSARRMAERDHRIVIEGIRKFGFMRLDGKKMVERGPRGFQRVRRISRREARVQEIALSQNLTREDMLKATEQLSRFGVLQACSQSRAVSNRAVVEKPETINPSSTDFIRDLT